MEKLDVSKSIIFYTDSRIEEPIKSLVHRYLLDSGLFIVSTSLRPLDFGLNIVVEGERGYPTMVKQIVSALEWGTSKYVFFCEHDVLYPKDHFDFTPPRDDIFYYNINSWRWELGSATLIRHDRMLSLSCLCVNRLFALDHFQRRLEKILSEGFDKINDGEPKWVRTMGYEPGTKKRRRGGFSDDDFDTWESPTPVIDIRHKGTFSSPKTKLSDFKHPPKWWEEKKVEDLHSWDLKGLFNL
jgi:hypothetical protein